MTITTNHHWRPILDWYELTTKEQKELEDSYDSVQESSFFRYRGQVYDLSEFETTSSSKEFDGMKSGSFFSAIAIKVADSCDAVKVLTIIC